MTEYDKPLIANIETQASQILCASLNTDTFTETFTEESDYTIFE